MGCTLVRGGESLECDNERNFEKIYMQRAEFWYELKILSKFE